MPCHKMDVDVLEIVQMLATKIIPSTMVMTNVKKIK